MTRLGLALAAAAALAAAPPSALAQRAGSPAPPPAAAGKAAPAMTPKQMEEARKRGMKEVPAILAASDVAQSCQLRDAAYRGQGAEKGADGKEVKLSVYEVGCQTGPGYVLISRANQPKPSAVNCILAQSGGTKCELPGNTDVKAAIAPAVQATGRSCTVTNLQYVGSSSTDGRDFYEIACTPPQLGFRMGVKPVITDSPVVDDCANLLGTSQECKLTTKAQILESYAPLVAKSGKACQVSDFRSIGRAKSTGETYVEIACGAQPGFVLITDNGGAFKSAVDCAKAGGIGDGCKLTDVTVAKTEEAGTYARLAKKAGYDCDVKEYRFIGMDAQNREVVELSCKNRPDGALALFAENGPSRITDCVRAGALGGSTCKLSDPSVVYPKYSEALASKGRNTCKVSNAQFLARTTDGTEYVETACADGNPGWVIAFTDASVKELLTCRQAGNSGLACKLPTNKGG